MLKILFLSPHRYTGTMSFAMESIMSFAKRGHFVDVVISSLAFPPVCFSNENIQVFIFKEPKTLWRYTLLSFFRKTFMKVLFRKYDVIICLSEYSLLIGWICYLIFKTSYVYYNDELHYGTESKRKLGKIYGHFLKKLERIACRYTIFTVTQDRLRGQELVNLNHIPLDSIRYLPNSRCGNAEIKKSFYLHDKLGISRDIRIILWLGGVLPGSGALELARTAEYLPSNCCLVYHFSKRQTDYIKRIRKYHGNGKVFVSIEPIAYEDVNKIVGSASIGLGLYSDEGKNVYLMGAASGKVNLFLQSGIPCIVNNYVGFRWVEDNGAGLCIKNISEVFDAAQRIFLDYKKYQERSVATFNRFLNYDKAFNTIADELEKIIWGKDRRER